jgi:hypothetical protein
VAVVEYQCSVCKRTIDLVQNQQGLEWIGHCNITLGCRGTLYQIDVLPDYTRGVPTPDVVGLKNWVQRKVLFNFAQAVARNTWTIQHNLGTAPSVVVFVNQPTQENPDAQVEVLPEEIIYNNDDQLTLIFPKQYSGIAQCIARSSNPDLLAPRPAPPVVTKAPTIQLTNHGTLTIATKILTVGNPANLSVTLSYLLGSNAVATQLTYTASNVPSSQSPWSDTSTVIIKGKSYTVRSFNIQTAQTVSGQISNGSTVLLTSINSTGTFNIPVVSVALTPVNQFVVTGDYSLYFEENSIFSIIGATTPSNNIPWVVASSLYDPATNQTTITVSNDVTGTFGPSTQIVCSGVRQIAPGEVLILLGTPPFTIFDKITNAYIDFTAVDTQATQFDLFFYNGGDLFADTVIETTIYPPIRPVS